MTLSLRLLIPIAAAAVLFLSESTPARSEDGGKELFQKRCGGCHALDRDKEGPRLGGVYGRAAGSVKSFQYSDALRKSGITWTQETLDKWLADTGTLVPDNDMAFRVENADERRILIAYLKGASSGNRTIPHR